MTDRADKVTCPPCSGTGIPHGRVYGNRGERCPVCGGFGDVTVADRDAWWARHLEAQEARASGVRSP